jgi:hypothetical protein
MRDIVVKRPTLGPFMSVVCFRYLHDDTVDLAGTALIIDAGRQLGRDLIEELGLIGKFTGADDLLQRLHDALGPDGTRLCLIEQVIQKDNGGFEVHSVECASPLYTLGVLIGAISSMTGKTLLGEEVAATGKEGVEGRIYSINPL